MHDFWKARGNEKKHKVSKGCIDEEYRVATQYRMQTDILTRFVW